MCNCNSESTITVETGPQGDPGNYSGTLSTSVLTGAISVLTAAQTGTVFVLDRAAGITITLPPATTANIGVNYEFDVLTTASGGLYIIRADSANDPYRGSLFGKVSSSADVVFNPDGTDYLMTFNGGDQGGRVGTHIRVYCYAANRWFVEGNIVGSPAPLVNPFT